MVGFNFFGLLAIFGIDPDGDGAIVDEADLHIGTEFAGLDGDTCGLLELVDEGLVEGFGVFGSCGADEGRAVAFFDAGVEGELADDEELSIDAVDVGIDGSGLVCEESHAGDF